MEELPKALVQILPLITLFLGWGLSELSGFLKGRRQSKRELNLAIAEMLEVYQSVHLHSRLYSMLTERYNLTARQKRELRAWLKAELPQSDSLQERLRATIQSVASIYPVLGAAIRSSQVVQSHFFINMEDDVADEAVVLDVKADEASAAGILSKLRDYLLALARKSGWLTWLRVRRYVKNLESSEGPTPEQQQFIAHVDEVIVPRLTQARPANPPPQADEGQ
jgi:hypothetical protein